MKAGLLGKKLGMTQMFSEDGKFMPVTVIEAGPCPVLMISKGKALLGFGEKKEKNIPKSQIALYKKLNLTPKAFTREVEFDSLEGINAGHQMTVEIFKERDFVDISGISKGKGFQGGVKRWHWLGGPDGHGSMHHRRVGSIGASSFPSRVLKGQRLPGRMGNERKTVQNLEILKIDKDQNIIMIKGPVPGANNGYLEIRIAKKRKPSAAQGSKKPEPKDADKKQGKK
ncbi:MAG TPA: 50S ribosomal protein L3 [Candidatus Omnitrophica bacterium]|nr:50S ribosomal protein L3 [Candidatus Omnitrophota bacterium]